MKFFNRDGQEFIRVADLQICGEKLTDAELDDMLAGIEIDSDGKFKYQEFVDQMISGI